MQVSSNQYWRERRVVRRDEDIFGALAVHLGRYTFSPHERAVQEWLESAECPCTEIEFFRALRFQKSNMLRHTSGNSYEVVADKIGGWAAKVAKPVLALVQPTERPWHKKCNFSAILAAVCSHFGVTREDLVESYSCSYARKVLYFLAYKYTHMAQFDIGMNVGRRGQSVVSKGISEIRVHYYGKLEEVVADVDAIRRLLA